MIARFCSFFCLLSLLNCNQFPKPGLPSDVAYSDEPHPRNVILMIGDGMGLTQVSAGMFRNGNKLNLEEFPVIGLHKPYSGSDLITDSAAGATAFASGVKTYNGAIGVNMDTLPVKTILEEAEERGLATGMVTTSSIVHATPAAFIAHEPSRELYEAIALDFMKTEIDFFIGGGMKYFAHRKTDQRNLYVDLQKKGYTVNDYTRKGLSEINLNESKNFAYFTAEDEPLAAAKGRDYLLLASHLAVDFLHTHGGSKGFFLMIEGAQIDWGGHDNNSDYIVSEMIDFDRAIGEILKFAREDGETLVIVTADHETGGFAINPGSTMDSLIAGFTTKDHTASLIPVFAFGPGSERFNGIYENTAIYTKLRQALGFEREMER
ncbi:MAG TPA: alkaline phosphatase [Saprospiraceae bacterium]|nr:alkaline phosphatase [Saprospiraceae bacterium]